MTTESDVEAGWCLRCALCGNRDVTQVWPASALADDLAEASAAASVEGWFCQRCSAVRWLWAPVTGPAASGGGRSAGMRRLTA